MSNNGQPKKSKLLNKYRLTIHNENKRQRNIRRFYISPLSVLISLFILFLLVVAVLYLIVVFTPVGNLLPGYSRRTKEELISSYLKIDSISREVEKQERYLSNIKAIMNGEITLDSLKSIPEPVTSDSISIETTELEQAFANEWEERERYNLTSQATNVNEVQALKLFRPAQGEVIEGFDVTSGHYGVDIAEVPGESICAIHDGTVVMSDFTATDGYTIVIQHKENLISIYRNCYRLMKNVGDKVMKGEAIGTFSNRKDDNRDAKKKFLHLELWHRGKPLDPNTYIAL
ncbi:MAG: M23 family metallopeptidase [Bacteroidaceae bacterium]|nr:M23 family metallopeptidase [Bacteroidaceae bacterium]